MANSRLFLVVGALVALSAGASLWVMGRKPGVSVSASSPGGLRSAPAFALKDSSGRERKLEELRGKVVMVHFWATWCAPCLAELPDVIEMARRNESSDLRVVAVSLDDSWEKALSVLPDKVLPSNMISLLDLEKAVPEAYGSYQYPETYLLNRELSIVHKFVGPQDWNGPELTELFKKLF